MEIDLKADQRAWLEQRVADGEYASVPDAISRLIDAGMVERAYLNADDLAWAKPFVDEGVAAVERGDVMSLEEHQARIANLRVLLTR